MTQVLNATVESKLCPDCNTVKPSSEFNKDPRNKSGLYTYCRPCKYQRYKKNRNPGKRRLERVKYCYNLELEEYKALVKAANKTCQTCGTPEGDDKPSRLVVDHCHATGKVRGLICDRCNRALGLVGDNTQTLSNLITYLKNESLSKTATT